MHSVVEPDDRPESCKVKITWITKVMTTGAQKAGSAQISNLLVIQATVGTQWAHSRHLADTP